MAKIPVKIVEVTSPSGQKAMEVMLDVMDYGRIDGAQEKMKKFKVGYFDVVEKARNIMPGKRTDRKASHFWKVGRLLYCFNRSIRNDFEIADYNSTVSRDFKLYGTGQVGNIIRLGELFEKKDIDDSIPISVYLELLCKAELLKRHGLLEREKKRLVSNAKKKAIPTHKTYRDELNKLVLSLEDRD